MGLGTSIRGSVRSLITSIGSNALIYNFGNATKTYNDEGDVTITDWKSGTSIKVVSSSHYQLRRTIGMMGEETNNSERVFIIRDDVSVNERDKIVINSESYEVTEIKKLDPIENVLVAYRIQVSKNENY